MLAVLIYDYLIIAFFCIGIPLGMFLAVRSLIKFYFKCKYKK